MERVAFIWRATKMKFKVNVIDTEKFFRVQVFKIEDDITDESKCIWNCGWKGDEFEYNGDRYSIIGPYHDFPENKGQYRVYQLIMVSEVI